MVYLRESLIKSKGGKGASKPQSPESEAAKKNKQGEARGGKYVARIQIGYEKDGSPRYKYFSSFEERDKYLENRGKSGQKAGEKLKAKLNKEQEKSKEKADTGRGRQARGDLFIRDDKKTDDKEREDKDKEDTKKSLSATVPVFIWRF